MTFYADQSLVHISYLFKELFDIVSIYAKDMPKNTASTKQWLGVVAKQNATTVINLERALRTK